ncbi:MAG: ABC transporter substrate-binding protein [Treponema sp.]|jgi:iron complex transport system substrate-binding protein|nr:ABC transporter substrate-binding protein [Treponema sp.]
MKFKSLVFFSVFLCLLCACRGKDQEKDSAAAELQTSRFSVTHARLFGITWLENGAKLVRDGHDRETLLVPRGAEIPEGYDNIPVVRTPIEKGFFMSTTYVGLLDALGKEALFDTVGAVITPVEDWTTEGIVERMKSGKTLHIPWGGMGQAGDIEGVTRLKPDVIFSGPDDQGSIIVYAESGAIQFPYVVVSEYLEETGEAMLEWIKFIAAFYNLDAEADAVYAQKLARMTELREKAAAVPQENKPVVATGSQWMGIVYMSGAESRGALELAAAGGLNAFAEIPGKGSTRVNLEEFVQKGKDADILLYTSMISYLPDKQALLAESPLFAEFRAFKNDRVYVLSKGYYINSAQVDVKFEDLTAILHPELFPGRDLTFYVKLPDTASQ